MTTDIVSDITATFLSLADEKQAAILQRFFKTAPGQYGYGDKFLGLRVPQTRAIVKEARRLVTVEDACRLVRSEWHEIRLAGFLLLIELYRKAVKAKDSDEQKRIVDTYVSLIPYGNNWDLVDLVSQYILGDWLRERPDERATLYRLASSSNLWENRVSVVATLALIRDRQFDDTLRLAELHIAHPHDLMHKAVGWMLREVGKRDESVLTAFLDTHAASLPRTALRYSLERLPAAKRKHYMELPQIKAATRAGGR